MHLALSMRALLSTLQVTSSSTSHAMPPHTHRTLQLGIGGLDKQFEAIFRRAFASRVFPPSIVQKLGIRHVKVCVHQVRACAGTSVCACVRCVRVHVSVHVSMRV